MISASTNLMTTSGPCPLSHLPARVAAAQRPLIATLPEYWQADGVLMAGQADGPSASGYATTRTLDLPSCRVLLF